MTTMSFKVGTPGFVLADLFPSVNNDKFYTHAHFAMRFLYNFTSGDKRLSHIFLVKAYGLSAGPLL